MYARSYKSSVRRLNPFPGTDMGDRCYIASNKTQGGMAELIPGGSLEKV